MLFDYVTQLVAKYVDKKLFGISPIWRADNANNMDMGDLSAIMPVVHPYVPGAVGISHGVNYYVENPELACVTSANWQRLRIACNAT